MQDRKGNWMSTFSGIKFWPVDPRSEDIHIVDIAHALSMSCRYNGHTHFLYSVAQHSWHMSYEVSEENALWALLHDASEAYISDIPSPLKPSLTNYYEIEDAVMKQVCIKFGLPIEMPAEVKDVDRRILADEKKQVLLHHHNDWAMDIEPLGITIPEMTPKEAKRRFLSRFVELTEKKIEKNEDFFKKSVDSLA